MYILEVSEQVELEKNLKKTNLIIVGKILQFSSGKNF